MACQGIRGPQSLHWFCLPQCSYWTWECLPSICRNCNLQTKVSAMRYRLRTLLILMAVVAPLMLFAGWCVIWAILVTKISLP